MNSKAFTSPCCARSVTFVQSRLTPRPALFKLAGQTRKSHLFPSCPGLLCCCNATVDRILEQTKSNTLHTIPSTVAEELNSLHNPTETSASFVVERGQGVWEVFHAPHIRTASVILFTTFNPVRYILKGDTLVSQVGFSTLFGVKGWLCSSGTIHARDVNVLKIDFDKFWIDFGADNLRETLGGELSPVDQLVSVLGRIAFIGDSAVFPVLFFSDKLAVFKFPALNVTVSIKKML